MDAQSTAADFNLWLTNTKAVAASLGLVCQAFLAGMPSNAQWTGAPGSEAAQKTSTSQGLDVKYRITGNANLYSGSLNVVFSARLRPTSEIDTLGSFTFDVYYNNDQLYYAWPLAYQPLLDAGYILDIYDHANEHGSFVRVEVRTAKPDTVSYEIDGTYNPKLLRLRFYENNGPVTSHDVAFNLASLSITVIRDGKVEDPVEIVPYYSDVYNY